MKLPSANEVMLRINDVALRANGHAFGVIWRESPKDLGQLFAPIITKGQVYPPTENYGSIL